MAFSLHQWESDPLFSAAEVVQDSADRMESLFRILQHQQSLVHDDFPDPRLISSMEHHKRDLATILETVKWQLEDFERAVDSLAVADKSGKRDDMITRQQQFIHAIKEHINHVERNIGGPSIVESLRSSEWVDFNEPDRDGLALFLIGGSSTKHSSHHDTEDSSILGRFFDPSSASSLKDNEIVENSISELDKVQMNGNKHAEYYIDKDTSNASSQEIFHNKHDDGDQWDLEANEPKVFFHENKLSGFNRRMNLLGSFSNLRNMYERVVGRNYTKRLKDGEEQIQSPTHTDDSQPSTQAQQILGSGCRHFHGLCSKFQENIKHLSRSIGVRYQRLPCQVNRHSMWMILTLIFVLVFFGVLRSKLA